MAAEKLPERFEYIQPLFDSDRERDLSHYDNQFDNNKFFTLKLPGEAAPTYSIDWADRAYIHMGGSGLIILKAGVEVSSAIQPKVLYKVDDGFIVHLKTGKKDHYDALYFSGKFTEENIKSFFAKRDFTPTKQRSYAWLWDSILIPSAFAAGNSACESGLPLLAMKQLQGSSPVLIREIAGCVKGALSGAWNATGGALVSLSKGVAKAFTDPAEAFRSVKNGVLSIGHFIVNAGKELARIGEEFLKLPREIQAKVFCELASSIGVSAVVAIATGGAAIGFVWRHAIEAILKVHRAFKGNRMMAALAAKAKAYRGKSLPPEGVSFTATLHKRYETVIAEIDALTSEMVLLDRNKRSLSNSYRSGSAGGVSAYQMRVQQLDAALIAAKAKLASLAKNADRVAIPSARACTTIASLEKAANDKLKVLERRRRPVSSHSVRRTTSAR